MLVLAVACGAMSFAQSRTALRINEVMIENTSDGIADEYGQHPAWIEIFNSNFAPINISSIFITNDKNNPTLYPVPLGDAKTIMPTRQHILFYADGEPNKGTFHTSLLLTPGQENWIAIYDADGKTLIDSVTVPANVLAGQSWARLEDGAGKWALRTGEEVDDYITPSSANIIKDGNDRVKSFAENDKHGFSMTLMAMGIVFSALLVLCLCFIAFGKIGSLFARFNKARATGANVDEMDINEIRAVKQDTGEEIAAIVMALHEHLDAHDSESTILTIDKVRRAYSPWSSKIYNLREVPNLRK